ncbi:hypothetical protein DUNSADRAFT_3850 [Dunaliella salina]|uniref:Uncharacterized protein n=1 Tax=Dunaliella salina TaxID=3046 RepID=A0ABQ7GT82_DUNSA|nr:hypothetical protein DUNSADRAFT_3850 [Dunaliella salina]|eukprot:KAF5837778.1 hypothetical protein DUNSADRAFT_3850 [Dunaliella salina]
MGRTSLATLLLTVLAVSRAADPRPAGECLQGELRSHSLTFPRDFFIEAPEEDRSDSVKLTAAEDFSVEYYDHFKVVRNLYQDDTYVLYHCGMDAPTEDALPADLQGKNFSNFFAVPLHHVSVPDTSAFAFLKELGLENRIRYVTQYAVDSCAAKLYAQGDDACNKRTASSFSDPEGYQAQYENVDGILQFSKSAEESKVIAFTAVQDPGVLNRAEWLKFMATFFNVEDKANTLFNQIKKDYNDAKEKIANNYPSMDARPLVAWLYYQPAQEFSGFKVDELVELKFGTFQAEYMQDAGGRMLDFEALNATYTPGNDNINEKDGVRTLVFKNLNTLNDTLADILKDVKFIIDETDHGFIPESSNKDLTIERVAQLYRIADSPIRQSLEDGSVKIVRLDASEGGNGGTSWFQGGVSRPDIALKELAMAFMPSSSAPLFSVQNKHVRILGNKQPTLLSAEKCSDEDFNDCVPTSSLICPMLHRACDGSIRAATTEQRCAPTVEECENASDAESARVEVSFTMDGAKADNIAAGNDVDRDVTKFKEGTVATMREMLNEGRNTSTDGLAHVRLISTLLESSTSSRRTLLDSHYKELAALYRITVNGGGSGQVDEDVQKLDSELDSEDGSVWGTLQTEFDLQSTTATVSTDGGSPAGSMAAHNSAGLALLALALLLAVMAM